MASILGIPLEVLLQITSHLTTPEYGYLRRSCRQIEAMLFGAFAKEFFSKRQFALIEFSIQALIDMAKSRLGPSITHLIIHLEHPAPGNEGVRTDDSLLGVVTDDRAVKRNQYFAECMNHAEFITLGLDVEMLSEALQHLPNLETIGLRDFDSRGRDRDNTVWNSYGCPTFERKTDARLEIRGSVSFVTRRGTEYSGAVFLSILRALGNSAAFSWNPKLTRLEVLLHTTQFPDHFFRIPDRLEDKIASAMRRFTTIFLDNLSDWGKYVYTVDKTKEHLIPASGFYLSRFLARAPNLEHLRLNFQAYSQEDSMKSLLEWLAGPKEDPRHIAADTMASLTAANASDSVPTHYPASPEFQNLRFLDIGMATIKDAMLLALYRKFKATLRGVSLHKVKLTCGTATDTNLWTRLCDRMAKDELKLETLGLSFIQQEGKHRGRAPRRVCFKECDNEDTMVWRGSAFSQSVKDITDKMVPSWSKKDGDDEDSDAEYDSGEPWDGVDDDDEEDDFDDDEMPM